VFILKENTKFTKKKAAAFFKSFLGHCKGLTKTAYGDGWFINSGKFQYTAFISKKTKRISCGICIENIFVGDYYFDADTFKQDYEAEYSKPIIKSEILIKYYNQSLDGYFKFALDFATKRTNYTEEQIQLIKNGFNWAKSEMTREDAREYAGRQIQK